ncbi:hypothetical protein ENHYDAX1_400002 [Enhydrobacter sp. AX1]|nr:hypothetical protein ENHYDAX1_400002 [Enhydrobacter sp. AX1]
MTKVRKRHNAEFKSKVAVEAIKEQKTINELTAEYGVHATQISNWKKQALAVIPSAFNTKQHDNEQAQQATIDYEKKLTKNGYSSTEVMYGVINMQVELGVVSIEQLDKAVVETRQKYTYVWTRMEIRSILKSLGVTCMTVKLQTT